MSVDSAVLQKVATELFVPVVQRAHGNAGIEALKMLLDTVRQLYSAIDPLACNGQIAIAVPVGSGGPRVLRTGRVVSDFSNVVAVATGALSIEVIGPNKYVIDTFTAMNGVDASRTCVVYVHDSGSGESIWAGGVEGKIPSIGAVGESWFAMRAFSDLGGAFDHYRARMVRHSSCPLLATAWRDPSRRHYFRAAPETTLRRSLTHFLRAHLRGNVEIRPEQNVDETHPIDIKVTWYQMNRLALIEIKWLGDSIDEDAKITCSYRDARANSGAKQLYDYLVTNQREAPTQIARGYLVVFDARRRKLRPERSVLSKEDALYYRDKEITYDPPYHVIREDFDEPLRLFVEPAWQ